MSLPSRLRLHPSLHAVPQSSCIPLTLSWSEDILPFGQTLKTREST